MFVAPAGRSGAAEPRANTVPGANGRPQPESGRLRREVTPRQDTGCDPTGTVRRGTTLASAWHQTLALTRELDMTRTLGFFLAALLLASAPQHARAADLTLRDVIELHRSGLGEDLLIAVIDADGGPFTLTLADIEDLKSDGLSERVITALVRTGSRPPLAAIAGAPPVVVQQAVTTYVVPLVVVGGTSGSDGDSRRPEKAGSGPPSPPPPATWITRRADGQNVTPSGEVRSSVPAATWITPRDPKPRESSTPEKPRR